MAYFKKKKKNTVSIPISVKGEEIRFGKRTYTFKLLFIMTFLCEFVALMAVIISFYNFQLNGSKGLIGLMLSVLLFMWAQLYETILRKARKMSGRKTFIATLIEKIWGTPLREQALNKMEEVRKRNAEKENSETQKD